MMPPREDDGEPSVPLPSAFQCHAAFWAASVFDAAGCTQEVLNRSYRYLPTGGWHSQESLLAGQRLLRSLGLIEDREPLLIPTPLLLQWQLLPLEPFTESLVELVLTIRKDMWLPSLAGDDTVFWERVPDNAAKLLVTAFEDQAQRDAFVLSVARKVDAELLQAIGADGEEAVAADCRKYLAGHGRHDLVARVARVSLQDDALGYDVSSPDCAGRLHHLEVKATRSLGENLDFYISRNEADKGKVDPMWAVVVARQDIVGAQGSLPMRVVGWLSYEEIAPSLPVDAPPAENRKGRWNSARISVPETSLFPGLPLER